MVITIGNIKRGVSMESSRKNVSKEVIIKTTLKLIEEKEGIKDVNLRAIAKKIGCSHANLYNYFNSLDEIFWESLGQTLLIMIDYCEGNLSCENNPEENLYLLLANLVDFSISHPGWYRLIWLESIGGSPSFEVVEKLHTPGEELKKLIIKASNNNLSKEKSNLIYDILHSYLHGELCKWINNRSFINNIAETKTRIFSNLKYLYRLLIKEEFTI
jgi:AcrR family transcriptional regulator